MQLAGMQRLMSRANHRSLLGLPPNAANFGPSSFSSSSWGFGGSFGLSCNAHFVTLKDSC